MKIIKEINKKRVTQNYGSNILFENIISELNPTTCPYLIFEHNNGDYLQIAGSTELLTVEYRVFDNLSFKHFVIGMKEIERTWCIIKSGIGDIVVLKNELLNAQIAIEIVKMFSNSININEKFNSRNITKQFN